MGVLFWDSTPDAWDRIAIGGTLLPGIARADAANIGRQIQVKKAPGADGATIVDNGYEGKAFAITIRIWEESHLRAIEDLLVKVRPQKSGKIQAFDVSFPQLDLLGIRSIYITDIGTLKAVDRGIYELTLNCLEYIPLKSSGTTKVPPDIRKQGTPPAATATPPSQQAAAFQRSK